MNSDDNILLQIRDAIRLSQLRDKPQFVGFLNEDEVESAQELLESGEKTNYLL